MGKLSRRASLHNVWLYDSKQLCSQISQPFSSVFSWLKSYFWPVGSQPETPSVHSADKCCLTHSVPPALCFCFWPTHSQLVGWRESLAVNVSVQWLGMLCHLQIAGSWIQISRVLWDFCCIGKRSLISPFQLHSWVTEVFVFYFSIHLLGVVFRNWWGT